MNVSQTITEPEVCSVVRFDLEQVRDILKAWLVKQGHTLSDQADMYVCLDDRDQRVTLVAKQSGTEPPINNIITEAAISQAEQGGEG